MTATRRSYMKTAAAAAATATTTAAIITTITINPSYCFNVSTFSAGAQYHETGILQIALDIIFTSQTFFISVILPLATIH